MVVVSVVAMEIVLAMMIVDMADGMSRTTVLATAMMTVENLLAEIDMMTVHRVEMIVMGAMTVDEVDGITTIDLRAAAMAIDRNHLEPRIATHLEEGEQLGQVVLMIVLVTIGIVAKQC